MAVVFVKHSASTVVNGKPLRVTKGQAWDANDPFVKARPDLFVDEPECVYRSVEQATAAPGEMRDVKRGPGRTRKSDD